VKGVSLLPENYCSAKSSKGEISYQLIACTCTTHDSNYT